ncbi:SDR family oxidoreductase [Rhodococcus artemisiae]|uniref:SDR family oxidoreductase n=1 Tax=Rhodococcus artemisiae TaxID=714159 RepID=A0ABU7L633_9NOCA|nr:SDR family oxidoreductase [Rhodococcus artemisiae]MEE2057020.1 SDR family oxidoreductase [Rhodococcus artemisiae]
MNTTLPLDGKVALVAGATRGCGRAIAVELGALGATVYCSGRSTREQRSEMNRPETIEDTAELVDAAGGTGIPVRCDHGQEVEVAALVDRIRTEHGRLDILINDVWGGDPFTRWVKGVWEHPIEDTLRIVRNGIETHLITAHFALPLLIETGGGLVVEVGDGKAGVPFRGVVAYDHVKEAVVRLGFSLSAELRPYGATALSVTPGFLRSESMLDHFGVTEATWRDAADSHGGYFRYSETPHLLGRGIAALAADPDRARFAGQCLGSWDLMHTYGVSDVDGERPDWGVVDQEARLADAEDALPSVE